MNWNRMNGIVVFAVGASLLLPVLSAAPASAESFKNVTLTYHEGADPCITVDQDPVEIFWNKQPKKVKWVSGSGKDYYWEISWKGSDDDQPNYFGKKFQIKRGEESKGSDRPNRYGRTAPGASWAYTIKVYETSARVERGRLLCELDPAVDWGD